MINAIQNDGTVGEVWLRSLGHLMCSDCMEIFFWINSSRRCCSVCHSLAVFNVCSAFPLISCKLLQFFSELTKIICDKKFVAFKFVLCEKIGFITKKYLNTYLKSVSSKSYEFWSLVKFSSINFTFAAFLAISSNKSSCAFFISRYLWWYIFKQIQVDVCLIGCCE